MSQNLQSVLKEDRIFAPPEAFAAAARVGSIEAYRKLYAAAEADPEGFWAEQAKELLLWDAPWHTVLDWKLPHAKWFVGGKLNVAKNCLDRHLGTPTEHKSAIIWEGEPGDRRTLTYRELHSEVCRFTNALESLGVVAGDRVALYMPMVPELSVAMLACARMGATHSIIFGGFSAQAIRDRVNDATAKVIVTADGGWRRGKIVELKGAVDEALTEHGGCPSVEHVVMLTRTGHTVSFVEGRDHRWEALMEAAAPSHEAPALESEHPLFILYTSGSTGKPKGVLHTTGGYLLGATYSSKLVFDLRDDDVYWCTADIGWVTGHSYVVYGPLSNGATSVMYEGAPNHPEPDRFWEIIARYKVTIFYTAPTAIRAFIRWGDEHPARHDLSSLRLLGSVGEPINPEAWTWYHRVIGGGRCPIVDTWWQTETGSIMISPLPGATPLVPGTATLPLPGIMADVVDMEGNSRPLGEGAFW